MVAGHSSYTWSSHYDTHTVEATQILVSALQEKRDTIGPLLNLNLPKRPIEVDMKKRMDDLRLAKKKMRARKNSGLLSRCTFDKILSVIKVADSNVVEHRSTLSFKKFASMIFKIICQPSPRGKNVRITIQCGLTSERANVIKLTTSKALKKLKSGQVLKDFDLDVIHQLVLRIYLATKKK